MTSFSSFCAATKLGAAGTYTAAKRRGIVAAVAIAVVGVLGASTAASAGPMPHTDVEMHKAYAEHPTVSKVKSTGYLTVMDRERALSPRSPMDRTWAIVDAVGAKNARKYRVSEALVRALRARHSLGPSGALLDKKIPWTALDGRSALMLGWIRAIQSKSSKELAVSGTSIRDAGALQLLTHAAKQSPNDQAPQLALALVQASLAGRRGKCAAWQAVQTAARDGRKSAVALDAAERATKTVRKLANACKKAQRNKFSRPISLPARAAEVVAPRRTSRQAGRPTKRAGDVYRKGVAFAAVAPVFKGYMDVPLVTAIIRRTRLDQIKLAAVLKADQTGDTSVAVLNATLWSRRLPPDRIAEVGWNAILRNRNLLSRSTSEKAALKVSQLTPVEAMALGYARVTAGWGLERQELPGDPPAISALPRQLFARARGKLPMTASLGPIMAMLHTVDLHRQATLCGAAKRAESVAFVVGKSQLPAATKRVLTAATDMVQAQCGTVRGAAK